MTALQELDTSNLNKRTVSRERGLGIAVLGIAIFICNLIFIFSLFVTYFSKGETFFHNILAFLFGDQIFPSIQMIILGITLLILALFLILLGAKFSSSIRITILVITMLSFSLFSVLLGWSFLSFRKLESFYRIIQFLILLTSLIYAVNGVFLLKLKIWARKLTFYYSCFMIFCFSPLAIFVLPLPFGSGIIMANTFLTYVFVPLFFVIFLTRPHIKDLFGKHVQMRCH